MADIFISYSTKDREYAEKLCEIIEDSGYSCWMAPRNIVPGDDWATAINNAITGAKAFIVIYSENSSNSSQVPKEIGLASARRISIIPYKIDDTPLRGDFEYYLLASHWVVADPANGEYKKNDVLAAIKLAIARHEGKDEPTVTITNNYAGDNNTRITVVTSNNSKLIKIFVGICAALLVVAIVLVVVLLLGKNNDSGESVLTEQSSSSTDVVEELSYYEAMSIYSETFNKMWDAVYEPNYPAFAECFDSTYQRAYVEELFNRMQDYVFLQCDITPVIYNDNNIYGLYCFYANIDWDESVYEYRHFDFINEANILKHYDDGWKFSLLYEGDPFLQDINEFLYPYPTANYDVYTETDYQCVTSKVLCEDIRVIPSHIYKNEDGSLTAVLAIINGNDDLPTVVQLNGTIYNLQGYELFRFESMPIDEPLYDDQILYIDITTVPDIPVEEIDLSIVTSDIEVYFAYG